MRSVLSKTPLVQVGDRFARWIVIGQPFRNQYRGQSVVCQCDCGTVGVCTVDNLKRGQTGSCGCVKMEGCIKASTKHGLYKHPLYVVWHEMKRRCYDPKRKRYPDYGGRGITVCDVWREGFAAFYEWAAPQWKPGLQIDRTNNDGNYEPSNCRFVTPKENSRNRRQARKRTPVKAV